MEGVEGQKTIWLEAGTSNKKRVNDLFSRT
jgi:hypothetical protein